MYLENAGVRGERQRTGTDTRNERQQQSSLSQTKMPTVLLSFYNMEKKILEMQYLSRYVLPHCSALHVLPICNLALTASTGYLSCHLSTYYFLSPQHILLLLFFFIMSSQRLSHQCLSPLPSSSSFCVYVHMHAHKKRLKERSSCSFCSYHFETKALHSPAITLKIQIQTVKPK